MTFQFLWALPPYKFQRLTGITHSQFEWLLQFLNEDCAKRLKYKRSRSSPKKGLVMNCKLCVRGRLIMTLMRLRRGYPLEDIAILFGISTSYASDIINTWITFLWRQLSRLRQAMFVSRHTQSRQEKPTVFKQYDNLRCIIDSSEVVIEVPADLGMQGNTYSDYKGGCVMMFLLGISSWGGISFISDAFEGSITDKELYKCSGIRNFLAPLDVVLADRGFVCQEEADEDMVVLLHPPFLKRRTHFTPEEEQCTRDIAKARIYVEHVVRKMKCWKILKNYHNSMLPLLDQVLYICACLTNLQPPHVGKKTATDATEKLHFIFVLCCGHSAQ
ncbi:hypothetical protein ONE63_011368 [Megalurothrips usitatus]|uniref:DDE Tnp4 domain-containing protein n=1 Tax=Megalurothrips usitatus TaxID=439358 RepID=A0AAV7WZH8_9NEOP|nr:hypothetical protein ONE63_011368 [Megalurothrips usitatus]